MMDSYQVDKIEARLMESNQRLASIESILRDMSSIIQDSLKKTKDKPIRKTIIERNMELENDDENDDLEEEPEEPEQEGEPDVPVPKRKFGIKKTKDI